MDFKNAFSTMSYEMVAAALGIIRIPFLYIRLMLHLLRAPYLYSVGKEYVPGVYHHPRAGTLHGDPLSPALFSLVASFCTCGSLVAKWKCEVGAHLGLICALGCLCACFLCFLHAR